MAHTKSSLTDDLLSGIKPREPDSGPDVILDFIISRWLVLYLDQQH